MPDCSAMSLAEAPSKFILPNLVSHCHYTLHLSPHTYNVARASERWLLAGANHSPKRAAKFLGLKAGELTAACYPEADAFELRVCSDFMNWLFNLDDWLDEFDVEGTVGMRQCVLNALMYPQVFETNKAGGKLAKSYMTRFISTGGPGCTERFIHTLDLFFIAVEQQAADRADGVVPDLESYITVRRDTSGCKPCFALIEYAAGIDLPDEVAYHPVVQSLEEATNDLVTWSNDIFSYNVEQSRHDTHNMIPVIMRERGFNLQQAVDFVGDLCEASIQRFESERLQLPSWGADIDKMVSTYVFGLQNWIVGSLHWSFDTTRYFGDQGHAIKKHRTVHLLPKRPL